MTITIPTQDLIAARGLNGAITWIRDALKNAILMEDLDEARALCKALATLKQQRN